MSDDRLAGLARDYYRAFQGADRGAMEALLARDFTFTSPFDDHIDREHYFERCWPSAGSFGFRDDMGIFTEGEARIVLYSTDGKTGGTFRNAELFHFKGGQIVSIEIFFGFIPKAILKDPPAGS